MKQENEYHNNGGDTLHQGDTPQTSITEAKELITLEEAARFLGFKKSYLYKLTSTKQIPFYKYGGRVIAFDPAALQAWRAARLQYVPTQAEQATQAAAYCAANPLRR